MKILVAPNAFKNSLSAEEAGKAIIAGLRESNLQGEFVNIPIADGGDGSLMILAKYLNAQLVKKEVSGPVGKPVSARYAFNAETRIAIIELAEASGIRKIEAEDLNPWIANTKGTGSLIKDAVENGALEIILTVGGSATIDGGLGILKEIGVRFFTDGSVFVPTGPCDFHKIQDIDLSGSIKKYEKVKFTILADVENPLLGEEGAVSIFGKQKGLDEDEIELFEESLAHWARLLEKGTGQKSDFAKGGASGGVPAALSMIYNAQLVSGADYILELSGFKRELEGANLVITTEGQIDAQTGFGKGPGIVAKLAREYQIKCIGMCGQVSDDYNPQESFFTAIFPINSRIYNLTTAISRTRVNLRFTACQIGRLFADAL